MNNVFQQSPNQPRMSPANIYAQSFISPGMVAPGFTPGFTPPGHLAFINPYAAGIAGHSGDAVSYKWNLFLLLILF